MSRFHAVLARISVEASTSKLPGAMTSENGSDDPSENGNEKLRRNDHLQNGRP